jgi:transcriptional regulator with GAF, ATPase, and Fis domain
MSISAHLVVVPPGGAPRAIPLVEETTQIGSSPQSSVRVDDPDVEPVHAEVERVEGGFRLVRRGTTLSVNGRRVREHVLFPGDLVTVGRSSISFRLGPPVEPSEKPVSSEDAVRVCQRLYDFVRRLASGDASSSLLQHLLTDVIELTGADRGSVVLFNGEANEALTQLSGNFDGQEQALSKTAIAKLRTERKPLLWVDARSDADLASAPSVRDAQVRSLMCVPVQQGDQLKAALYVSKSHEGNPFTQGALDLLTVYANLSYGLVQQAEHRQRLEDEVAVARTQPASPGLIGSSPAMRQLQRELEKVAPTELSVLLIGETGTGKELIAREAHRLSLRSNKPFIAVNCGAIPEALLESELFGHLRGAFTDARSDRLGLIRAAHGGTLFLDEIGEMPLSQQAKLLRVLQDHEVVPVGGEDRHHVEFRLICATHHDLQKRVREGKFRQDLYFRLAGLVLQLPPLRDRGDDVVELAEHFLAKHRAAMARPTLRFSSSALTAIRSHGWPGNVRELEAAIRRGATLADGEDLTPEGLGIPLTASGIGTSLVEARDRYLKGLVKEVVDRHGGNRTAAARALSVTPRTIFKYLEEI